MRGTRGASKAVGASGLVALGLLAGQLPAREPRPVTIGRLERLDPAFDRLVAPGTPIEVLGDGYDWSEGPAWDRRTGRLFFSDIPRNVIHVWQRGRGVSVFRRRIGYTGDPARGGREPGTNGLAFDAKGRLVMCCHGDRCLKRLEPDGSVTVLQSRYQGKRFNSPNDLVLHSSGALYFTDPPYGLPRGADDPSRELDFCGVYRLRKDGTAELLWKQMTRPNGIAFSPDEKTLYVAQSDPKAALWMAFPVKPDGTLARPRVFADATADVGKRPGLPDGMAVDVEGNIWATGPGGVWVLSDQGKCLGRILTGQATANCTFGEDGRSLFITADRYLCRVRTKIRGRGF